MNKYFIVSLLTIALSSWAGKTANIKKATELKAEALSTSVTLEKLKEKESVEVLEYKGGWAKVSYKNKKGYVKILNLQSQTPATSGMNTEFAKTGSTKTIVSTGVKGVSEEQIKNLEAAPELAKKLDIYEPTAEQLLKFQSERKLGVPK